MTPEHRAVFERMVDLAKEGNEGAISFLRSLVAGLAEAAPPASLIKVVEAFNDAYTDEQIEYAALTRSPDA